MQSIQVNNHHIIPSKIVCVGRNYLAHINELNNEIPENMVVFVKPNSAISNELQCKHSTLQHSEFLHYEAEICFVIKNNQLSAVGIGLDLTKRNLQSELKAKGLPWERAKAFDGSAVFSEFQPISSISADLSLTLAINDKLTQHAKIANMIYSPVQILNEIQQFMTLNDGDIIMTGTPAGVGVVNENSLFSCELRDAGNVLIKKQWTAI